MDKEAVNKSLKSFKAKFKAAKKAGKPAAQFKNAASRLNRQLKAAAPRGSARKVEAKAE